MVTWEQMGRRELTVFTLQMGKLRHEAAWEGATLQEGLGGMENSRIQACQSPGQAFPLAKCLLAGCERYWLTPGILESFSLAALAAS